MRHVFEDIEDCPLLEQQLWNHVSTSCGFFEGIRELGLPELIALKSLVDARIAMRADLDDKDNEPK